MAKANLRNALLIGSTVAALATGIGTAAAQPGSRFQDQGVAEMNNARWYGSYRPYAYGPYAWGSRAYGYAPGWRMMHRRSYPYR